MLSFLGQCQVESSSLCDTDLCGLCELETETFIHLFLECEFTNKFWEELEVLLLNKTRMEIRLNYVDKIFGYMLTNNISKGLNTILIMARRYIFTCTRKKQPPRINLFLLYLGNHYKEQNALSKLNSTNEEFIKTWARFISIFP